MSQEMTVKKTWVPNMGKARTKSGFIGSGTNVKLPNRGHADSKMLPGRPCGRKCGSKGYFWESLEIENQAKITSSRLDGHFCIFHVWYFWGYWTVFETVHMAFPGTDNKRPAPRFFTSRWDLMF